MEEDSALTAVDTVAADSAKAASAVGLAALNVSFASPIAYAFADQPLTARYEAKPATAFSRNGKPIIFTRGSTGQYSILMEGLGRFVSSRPHLQVTPINTAQDTYCVARFVNIDPEDIHSDISCFRNGQPTDARFVFQLFDSTPQDGFAYATISDFKFGPGIKNVKNPWGVGAQVTRPSTGRYVGFFNLSNPLPAGTKTIAFVTPSIGDGAFSLMGSKCEIFSWNPSDANGTQFTFDVRCFTSNGTPANGSFNLLIDTPRFLAGFAWAHQPTTARYGPAFAHSFNYAGGTIVVERKGTGNYFVTFGKLAGSWLNSGSIMASAHGSAGESCEAVRSKKIDGNIVANVKCRRPGGSLMDSRFTIQVLSR